MVLLLLLIPSFTPSKAYSLTCENLFKTHQFKAAIKTNTPNKKRLRFMSYNVLQLYLHSSEYKWTEKGFKKVDQDHLHRQKPEYQVRGVAKTIFQANPDFLMLQEVEDAASLRRFAREYLGRAYKIFIPRSNDPNNIGMAFLIRENLDIEIKMESLRHVKWTNPRGLEQNVFSKSLPIFKFFTRGSDEPRLVVAGVHYKSPRDKPGDPKSFFKREAQVRASVEALQNIKKTFPDVPMVVMGDFNSTRGDHEIMPHFEELSMFDAHLSDERFVDTGGLGRATHTYHPMHKGVEQPTVFSVTDRALLTESLEEHLIESGVVRYKKQNVDRYKRLPETYADRSENPSDHFPIYFDLDSSVLFE